MVENNQFSIDGSPHTVTLLQYPMCENDNYLFDLKDNETHRFLASLEAFGK